jgi:FKBP-type peptidyl-prolyl cis-trans isomerase
MRTLVRKIWILPALLFLLMVGCKDDSNPVDPVTPPDYSGAPDPFDTTGIDPVVTDDGLTYYVIQEGSGPFQVVERDVVYVKYTLRDSTGTILDSSFRDGSTDSVAFSLTSVIEGFQKGMLGMKEGAQRKILVPPSMGYDSTSSNTDLVGKTLYFDVQLDKIASTKYRD